MPSAYGEKNICILGGPVGGGPVAGMARRQFLAKAAAVGGVTALASFAPPFIEKAHAATTINVRAYGAVGDGKTNDAAAIKRAQAALVNGSTLYFPVGNYRFATPYPVGGAAIALVGLSNVSVVFDPGAVLTMDNLSGGRGTSHGIRIIGAASFIKLVNPTIAWKTLASSRSMGDGIAVLGYPSYGVPAPGWTGSTGTVYGLTITNARVVNAPQTGAVIMGASDVNIQGFTAQNTLGDGLHFNACTRVAVNNYRANNTGDDGLAFVTYYHASNIWQIPDDGPFNLPSLGVWNNSASSATAITVDRGAANGIRVQGGLNLSISNAAISNCNAAGVIINSAIIGGNYHYSGVASQGINISGLKIDTCAQGIEVQAGNIDATSPAKFYAFRAGIDTVTVRNCANALIFTGGTGVEARIRAGITTRDITTVTA